MIHSVLAAALLLQAPPAPNPTPAAPAPAPEIGVEVTVSPNELFLGDAALLTLQVTHPEGVSIFFSGTPDIQPFRSTAVEGPNREERDDGTVVQTWKLTVRPMRLGRRKIPPMSIGYEVEKGDSGVVKTEPVDVLVTRRLDMNAGASLRGNDSPLPVYDTNWLLIIFLSAVGTIILTALLTVLALRYVARLPRRGPTPAPPRPAHEVAQERLKRLEMEQLLALGELREHTFRLSELLREYLGNRWNVDALEMTTSELLAAMRKLEPKGLSFFQLEEFLSQTDLVKFANLPPSEGEATAQVTAVESIVQKTRRSAAEVHEMMADEEMRRKMAEPPQPAMRILSHGLELSLIVGLIGGVVAWAEHQHGTAQTSWWEAMQTWHWVAVALLWTLPLFRDVMTPAGSLAKRMLGLAIEPDDELRQERYATVGSRIIRNLPLLVPVVGQTVEAVVILYTADGRRVGDRLAGTRTMDVTVRNVLKKTEAARRAARADMQRGQS